MDLNVTVENKGDNVEYKHSIIQQNMSGISDTKIFSLIYHVL